MWKILFDLFMTIDGRIEDEVVVPNWAPHKEQQLFLLVVA